MLCGRQPAAVLSPSIGPGWQAPVSAAPARCPGRSAPVYGALMTVPSA